MVAVRRLLFSSPLGPLLASYGEQGLHSLRFWRQGVHPPAGTRDAPERGDRLGQQLSAELSEYFAGTRQAFSVPLAPQTGTSFQRDVWNALLKIPCGETRSYKQVAIGMGRPGSARAVGQANARNPIPIIVPCHRVLAADGSLGGYMGEWGGTGAGLGIKRWLLSHEAPHSSAAKDAGSTAAAG